MKTDDIEATLEKIRSRPLKTICLLLLTAVLAVGGTWFVVFTQERAKQAALNSPKPYIIFVKGSGFKGIDKNSDKRDVLQLFGDPIEKRDSFWMYKEFGVGFREEKYVSNINFYFGKGKNWITEEGVTQGMNRQKVIEIYGAPRQAAFGGSVYYYDSFNVNFGQDGVVEHIVVYIGKREGVTFSEIEDLLIDEKGNPNKNTKEN